MKTKIIILLIFILTCDLFAADHENLEEGIPVQVEDAYATAYMNREIQFLTKYQHNKDDTDKVLLRPVFEYGLWMNTEIEIESDIFSGNADRTGSGDLGFKALYNFNTESLAWPAFAVAGGFTAPTGKNNDGLDTVAKFIMTKTIFGLHRVHFNYIWNNNDEEKEDERSNRHAAVIGYSFPINADTIFITDYLYQQERKKDEQSDIVEFGIRYKYTPQTVLAAGIGFGFEEDSPDVIASIGFQHSF